MIVRHSNRGRPLRVSFATCTKRVMGYLGLGGVEEIGGRDLFIVSLSDWWQSVMSRRGRPFGFRQNESRTRICGTMFSFRGVHWLDCSSPFSARFGCGDNCQNAYCATGAVGPCGVRRRPRTADARSGVSRMKLMRFLRQVAKCSLPRRLRSALSLLPRAIALSSGSRLACRHCELSSSHGVG